MEILKPIPVSENLIIFIHGFTGGKETWLNYDNTPKPLLSYILEDSTLSNNFHYAIFEYTTSIKSNPPRILRLLRKYTLGNSNGHSLPIKSIAANLKTQIELLITLATQHLGEGLTSIANVLFKNPQMVDLKLFSETIRDLTDSWIKKENLPQRVYFTAQYDDVDKIGATGLESDFVKRKKREAKRKKIYQIRLAIAKSGSYH